MRALLAVALAACTTSSAPPAPSASGGATPNYELDCAAANTSSAAQLHCTRTDTRTGEVMVVDYMRLPVSSGPTATGTAPAGRFTTACESASTDTRAEFFCIRMNTETGELLLVNLTQVGVIPVRK